ncbi:MAG: hypothetical protein ACHQ6T_16190 [Myxococcota bacterium]
MAETSARILLLAVSCYAAIGGLFALAFAAFGVDRIDPGARGAGVGFRLLIVPGATALWPLLLRRWLRGEQALPRERNAHRRVAR